MKKRREEEEGDTSCAINKDNISRGTGLLLIDAGCRERKRKGGVQCVLLV